MIIDIQMPGVSGFAVARELRELYSLDRPPLLIAITGKWTKSSDRLLAALVGLVVLRLLAPLRLPLKS